MEISVCSWAIASQVKAYHLQTQTEEEKSRSVFNLIRNWKSNSLNVVTTYYTLVTLLRFSMKLF